MSQLSTTKSMVCRQCSKQCRIPRNRQTSFKFCSRKCLWQWHNANDRVEVICETCSTRFMVIRFRQKTAKHCSRRCYYKSMNKRGGVNRTCVQCKAVFHTSPCKDKRYCSRDCYRNFRLANNACKSSNAARRFACKRKPAICENCGYDKYPCILHVHHINGRKDNRLEALRILCPNCHAIEHARKTGRITL